MEIRVLVTMQVEPIDQNVTDTREELEGAATEAVGNALKLVEANGYAHTYAEELSIGFVDAVEHEHEEE